MGWLTALADGILGRRETKAALDTIAVLARTDGFIPAIQFEGGGDLEQLYRCSSFAFACMNANSSAMASLPLEGQRRGEDGESRWVEDRNSPLDSWLLEPTGNTTPTRWSAGQLVKVLALHLYISGNAYVRPFYNRARTRVVRVEVWDPTRTTVERDERGRPVWYTGAPSEALGVERVGWRDIVHIQEPNPGSQRDGSSHLGAALDAVGADATAIERIRANLTNRISPGLILSVAGAYGFDGEQETDFLDHLRENYQQASQDGSPMVLGADAKVLATPDTSHQIDYRQIRENNRAEIVAVFGTPPPIIGDYAQATLQNFDAAYRVWWLSRLLPMLGHICDTLNRQLFWPTYGSSVRLWYALGESEIGLLLLRSKAELAKELVDIGYPANAANMRVGLGMPRFDALEEPLTQLVEAGRTTLDSDPDQPPE